MNGVQAYKLRLYDTELARFEFARTMTGFRACGLEIDPAYSALLPLNIAASADDVELARFLESRRIPKGRAYLEEVLRPYGLSTSDTKGIIDLSRGVSVNDAYSIVPEGDDIPYAEYNLFENDFDEVLQVIAYTGVIPAQAVGTGRPSDLTPSGVFPKTWRKVDGRLMLYKAGSVVAASNYGHEPFAERLAWLVARAMHLDAVEYNLQEWRGRVCSTCELFNDADTAFVPFELCLSASELRVTDFERALGYFESLGDGARERFGSVSVFDSIIANTDRHTGNFGVLRDNRTGRVLDMAPVFDNNVSLFTRYFDEHLTLDAMQMHLESAPGMLDAELMWQGDAMLGARQRRQVERLVDFEFAREDVPSFDSDSLSGWRLEILSEFIRRRAACLLGGYGE